MDHTGFRLSLYRSNSWNNHFERINNENTINEVEGKEDTLSTREESREDKEKETAS